jgi:hypothetical protein
VNRNTIRLLIVSIAILAVAGIAKSVFAEEVEITRDYGSDSYQYKALEALLESSGKTIDQLARVESVTKPGQFYFSVPASIIPDNALLNKTVELANKECVVKLPIGIAALSDVTSILDVDMPVYTKVEFRDMIAGLVGDDQPSKYIKEVDHPSIQNYLFASYYGVSIAKVKIADDTSSYVFYSSKTNCLNVVAIPYLQLIDPALLPNKRRDYVHAR